MCLGVLSVCMEVELSSYLAFGGRRISIKTSNAINDSD